MNKNKDSYKTRKYSLLPYDPKWQTQFESYKAIIKNIFGDVRIEHIGSTAVPGMSGKPCIDLLVIVKDLKVVESHTGDMQRDGFEFAGLFVMKDSLLFRIMKDDTLLTNVHFFLEGHPHNKEMIDLRDYLRSHQDEMKAYSEIKQDLYEKYPTDYASYRERKDKYMANLMERASEWGKNRI